MFLVWGDAVEPREWCPWWESGVRGEGLGLKLVYLGDDVGRFHKEPACDFLPYYGEVCG